MTNRPASHRGYESPSRPEFDAYRGIGFSIERDIGMLFKSASAFKLPNNLSTILAVSGVFLTVAGAYLLLIAALLGFEHGSSLPIGLSAIAMLVGIALVHRRHHQFGIPLSVAIAGAPAGIVAAGIAISGASTSYLGAGLAPAILMSAVLAANTRARSSILPTSFVISFPLAITIAANVMSGAGADLDRIATEVPIYAAAGAIAAYWARSHRASTEARNIIDGVVRRVAF
jgi:hypothetical protein